MRQNPSSCSCDPPSSPCRQKGAAAVEFALIAIVFFTLLLGIIEFGRVLFTWNSVAEATRWGARLAVVCDKDDATIKERMRLIAGTLTDSNIDIRYLNPPSAVNTCDKSSCKRVEVSVSGASITPMIPFLGLTLTIPPFTTSLPRESMESMNTAGEINPVCQ